jgi:hypothetical protein
MRVRLVAVCGLLLACTDAVANAPVDPDPIAEPPLGSGGSAEGSGSDLQGSGMMAGGQTGGIGSLDSCGYGLTEAQRLDPCRARWEKSLSDLEQPEALWALTASACVEQRWSPGKPACQCTFSTPAEADPRVVIVGKSASWATIPRDACEVHSRKYGCLIAQGEFAGCDLEQRATSCQSTCEQLETLHNEIDAPASEVELITVACGISIDTGSCNPELAGCHVVAKIDGQCRAGNGGNHRLHDHDCGVSAEAILAAETEQCVAEPDADAGHDDADAGE